MVVIEDLHFSYGKQPLFKALSLTMSAGNIYGLLGKNGAGKTSLLRLLAGQLYRESGRCNILGSDPAARYPEMLSEIYFLPEEFYVPAVKPREYVSMYAPFYPGFDESRFERLQHEFQLPETQKLSEYSYGQKKKLLIAFGLATGCSLILFDEPTNGLDIPSKSQFRRLVASSIDERQIFVISTHQVRDMENLIDPLIIVDEGRIIFQAGMEQVTKMLAARIVQAPPEGTEVLYTEKTLGGHYVLTRNTEGVDSAIDLELLFNAVVDESGRVRELFSQGGEA